MTNQKTKADGTIASGAEFSPCRLWRYTLWRIWSDAPPLVVIGLNPSTADETRDDPTIRRCIRFARDWGFGGYWMLNAYAFRATDPKVMQGAADPIGAGNDAAIRRVAKAPAMVLAAWGVHCPPHRAEAIWRALDVPVFCLGTTKSGAPRHPLYVAAKTLPVLWTPPCVTNR